MQKVIGNFRIVAKLGQGGMGEVYKGVDTVLEREVAIKVLRSELSSQPDVLERFRTEAIALARLNDPSIAMLYAFHQDPQQAYMVMEFVPGETLGDVIKREGKIPWRRTLKLICKVLGGLEHAHGKNIVHRDIKPANIMLTPDGEPKLTDFGIARILQRSRLTKTGYLIGTLQYMSPEQVKGLEADGRSDIYSVGIVLYEMLTGRVPFEKTTDYEIIRAQVEEPPTPPSAFLPGLDQAIEQAILKALAKNPSDRFNTAAEFRRTLLEICDRTLGGEEEAATRIAPQFRPTAKPHPPPFWARSGVIVGGLLGATVVGLLVWLFMNLDIFQGGAPLSLDSLFSKTTEKKIESEVVPETPPKPEEKPEQETAVQDEIVLPPPEIPEDHVAAEEDKSVTSTSTSGPALSEPVQVPEADLENIGIPLEVETVEKEPIKTTKVERKPKPPPKPVTRKPVQPKRPPAVEKKKDWSTLDFGESYE